MALKNIALCVDELRRTQTDSDAETRIVKAKRMPSEVKDRNSQPIKDGDHVWTAFRGGHREGDVDRIVRSEKEAKEAGVKNPPKVGSNYELIYNVLELSWLIGSGPLRRSAWPFCCAQSRDAAEERLGEA